jgi:chaperonin GroEL (HSP60 family)
MAPSSRLQIPGGEIEDCRVLKGVMINKDITHQKMRRLIRSPRILLLDCPLEYKKAETTANLELSSETDWEQARIGTRRRTCTTASLPARLATLPLSHSPA